MSARRRNIVENILQSQVDFDQKKRKAEEEEKKSRDSYPSTPTSGNHFKTIPFCLCVVI